MRAESRTSDATRPAAHERVWDPLVRLFHWTLAVAFATAWATADELQRLHELAGYLIVALLVARVLWGFIGETHARFRDFVRRPAVVARYLVDELRGRAARFIGHNPAGGAMVIAMLVVLGLTAGTGILMSTAGPVAGEWLEEVHEFCAGLALFMVVLHVAGVIWSSALHHENLVKAMVTGMKRREP